MFIKCGGCGYLTHEEAPTCKQCGADAVTRDSTASASEHAQPASPSGPAPDIWPTDTPASNPTLPASGATPPISAWSGPVDVVPPPPPPPPPRPQPSMFPESGAQAARRGLPTWTVACGAIAVVIALLLGLMTFARNGQSVTTVDGRQPTYPTSSNEGAYLDSSLLTAVDFGSEWTETGTTSLTPDELAWNETCSSAPGLQSTSAAGRSVSLSLNHQPDGREAGSALVTIREYRTAAEASAQLAARSDSTFRNCIQDFDRQAVACACHAPAQSETINFVPAPAGVLATVYTDTVGYQDNGPKTYSIVTGYTARGRYVAILNLQRFAVPVDQVQFDELLSTLSQRLELNAPQ